MINLFVSTMKNLDVKIKNIMRKGLNFSLLVSIIGTLFLLYYISFKSSNFIYYIGINIVFLSISFGVSFLACALAIDRIKKDIDF